LSVYLDASVLLTIVVKEPGSDAINQFLEEVDTTVWVSEFASAEVASALSRLLRMKNLSLRNAQDRLAAFDDWIAADANLVDVEGVDVRLAARFVRRFDLMLRAPDALHLAMCRRLNATIATLDRRLAVAAQALDIPVASL
jgi:predicted nucleic acid-binding protein